jgi:hypothetical protein
MGSESGGPATRTPMPWRMCPAPGQLRARHGVRSTAPLFGEEEMAKRVRKRRSPAHSKALRAAPLFRIVIVFAVLLWCVLVRPVIGSPRFRNFNRNLNRNLNRNRKSSKVTR